MLTRETKHIAIIGAGIGGLASALRLANAGFCVDVFEAHSAPGGKMRTLPTAAGPVDAGPTVLTMLSVFEDLFKDVGTSLAAELTLLPQNRLARHFWQDGTELDLYADPLRNAQEIERVFGTSARQDFRAFQARTKTLFDAFAPIMMEAPNPTLTSVTLACLKNPRLLAAMPTQTTLQKLLRKTFREPKLAQLFGRYATYVGGSLPQFSRLSGNQRHAVSGRSMAACNASLELSSDWPQNAARAFTTTRRSAKSSPIKTAHPA